MTDLRRSWATLQQMPLRVTLLFVGLSTAWILFSDAALAQLFPDPRYRALAGGVKGLFYTLIVGALVYIGTSRWITHARRQEEAIEAEREQERQHQLLLEAALSATAAAVLITDTAGQIEWVNPAFVKLTGFSVEEVVGQSTGILYSDSHPDTFYNRIWATLRAGEKWHGQLRNRRKDGMEYDAEMTATPVTDRQGRIHHFTAILTDLTRRQERERQMERLRTTDPLTGLANRSTLSNLLGDPQHGTDDGSLVVIDIDRLQHVNQALGHHAGDMLLIHVANQVAAQVGQQGIAARIGEDEFAMVLRGPASAGLEAVEQVRRRLIEQPLILAGLPVEVSLSAGIAPLRGSAPAAEIQVMAEQGLAEAKAQGGNRSVVRVCPASESENMIAWTARLKQALREDGLILHFQPIQRLQGRRSTHAETLIRMPGTDGTLLPPARFLPIAEQLHLMPQIDRWVVRTVMKVLRERPALKLFVNLAGQSLNDMTLLREIRADLERERDVAARIIFEITESTAIQNLSAAQAWMSEMRSLGLRFALDDFGTGFSSFAYLRALPVDYVKLDGSFVQGILADQASQAMVRSVAGLAHALGKRVVAEAVETEQVAELLTEMGIEYGQGFGLARPSPDLSWIDQAR